MPYKVASISPFLLPIYHLIVLIIAYRIVNYELRGIYASSKERYYTFFLLSYNLSLLLAYFLWFPYLAKEYNPNTWGAFDPIKYYAMAHEMVKGVSIADTSNFPVVYIFYFELLLLGGHPIIPYFFNLLFFLYAVLILGKFLSKRKPRQINYYAWLLLIPEVLFFNITASKDIICLICVTILFVHTQKVIRNRFGISNVVIIVITFGVLFVARTSMAMMSMLCVLIFYINPKNLNRKTLFFALIGVGATLVFMNITKSLGQADRESLGGLTNIVEKEVKGDMSSAIKMEDAGALATALIPSNTIEFFVFGIARSIVTAMITTSDIFDFKFFSHVNMTVQLTSYLMTLSWPIILYMLFKRRKYKDKTFNRLFIVTLLYVLFVGMSTPLMIHRRYRVVYDVLFFAVIIKSYLLINLPKKIK